jgi:hypothetical protein
MSAAYVRVMLYVLAMVLMWIIGASRRKMFFSIGYLSMVFAILASTAFLKAIDQNDISSFIFDVPMTLYLVGLVIVLVRAVWSLGQKL